MARILVPTSSLRVNGAVRQLYHRRRALDSSLRSELQGGSSEYLMRGGTLTTWNEKGCGPEAGNHKGCPYNGFVGVYFRSNRSCRFSPTPPIMKMGLASSSSHGRRRGLDSGLRRNDGGRWRGLFSEESFMSVVTDTTNHENGRAIRESPLREVGCGLFSEE